MLPPIYLDASARCVTPRCPQRERIGMALSLVDGTVVRVALTVEAAQFFIEGLQSYINSEAGTQSEMSSLMATTQPTIEQGA